MPAMTPADWFLALVVGVVVACVLTMLVIVTAFAVRDARAEWNERRRPWR